MLFRSGSEDAVCTSATITGEVVSVVINHAAATSFIHRQTLAATQTHHSMRNTGLRSGAVADRAASGFGLLAGRDMRPASSQVANEGPRSLPGLGAARDRIGSAWWPGCGSKLLPAKPAAASRP